MTSKEEISNIDLKNIIEKETGLKFDRHNKIRCPFHSDDSPSFIVKKYQDKDRYYCFGCGEHGDVVDYIKKYKNMNYIEACNYLNVEANEEYGQLMTLMGRVEETINKINFKDSNDKPLKYIHTYIFVDQYNKPLYFEAKFKDSSNKSTSRFLSINNEGNVIPSRGVEAVPYNFYKLLEGLKGKKDIFIVEGAKDADTLNYMGYIATSFKGVTNFDYSIFEDARVYIIPDTGLAGEKYKEDLYYNLKGYVKEFNVIYPKGWDKLPSNFDITDWFKSGKTLCDFREAIKEKWDYQKNRDYKYVTPDGRPLIIWENFARLCAINEIEIKYNELFKVVEFTGKTFELSDSNSCYEDLFSLCKKSYFKINRMDLNKFIYRISQANAYNPVQDYLLGCELNWDGKEGRIQELANSIVTTGDYDDNFKLLLLKKWLIGTANIAFNDGGQNMNGVFIIQGDQGIYKTKWIKTLVPEKSWVASDKLIDPKNKDLIIDVTSSWITELGEIKASIKPEKIDELKMFLTRETDRYRKPYAAEMQEYPRITSFYGTVNNNEFLLDKTGNRRFWIVKAKEMILDHNVDIYQMWGEVMNLRKNKFPHWLSKEEEKQLYVLNSNFEVKTETDSRAMDNLNWSAPKEFWIYKTFTQVCNELDIKPNAESRNTLTKLGAVPPPSNKPFRVKGYDGSKRWWMVPPVNFTIEDDNSIEIDSNKFEDIQQKLAF